jgi:hypothetical protein
VPQTLHSFARSQATPGIASEQRHEFRPFQVQQHHLFCHQPSVPPTVVGFVRTIRTIEDDPRAQTIFSQARSSTGACLSAIAGVVFCIMILAGAFRTTEFGTVVAQMLFGGFLSGGGILRDGDHSLSRPHHSCAAR